MTEEFDLRTVAKAIEGFLELGEATEGDAHGGYFSGDGFAARVLRWHLEQLKKRTEAA